MPRRFLCILFGIVFILFQAPVSAQPTDVTLSSQKIIFEKKEKNFIVSAEYPQFSGDVKKAEQIKQLNDTVKSYVEGLFAIREGKLVVVGPGVDVGEISENELKSIYITCDIDRSDTKFVSIKFERYFYAEGAAHGVTDIFGFNYDFQHQKIMKLEDLFEQGSDYVKQICDYCDRDLIRQLKGFWNKGDMTKDNLDQYTFSHRNLTIHFSAYQVASYAAGTPEVSIRFAKLKGIKKEISGRR